MPVVSSSSHVRVDSASRDLLGEDHESLAFDSSDEVTPLMGNAQDSDEGSLAMSTTNIRTLGKTNYMSSVNGSRVSYHSQMSSAETGPMDTHRMMEAEEAAAERERREDMEALVNGARPSSSRVAGGGVGVGVGGGGGSSATDARHQRTASNRTRKDAQGSDESDDDDGSVTWISTAAAVDAQYRQKRASSGLYDGLSSAHSSDSESFKRRSYLKPRPATERKQASSPASGYTSPSLALGTAGGNVSLASTTLGAVGMPPPGKRGSGTFRAAADDDRIKINVGGRIFETYVSTLRKYPHTLLGTMLHPRNAHMLNGKVSPDGKPSPDTELFFDRNPRMFEVILDFYRTSTIHRPPDVTWEMLQEELSFFQIDLPEYTNLSKRVSVELRKLEYKDLILPASEYRKMMRVKLLKDHHTSIVRILDFIQRKVQRKADAGHNTSTITFYSPLHYTNSTPREIFKVISTNEVRELLIELLRSKDFQVKETNEYSKTKTTSIIGLHDQIINYNDPQYFSFHIKW